MTEKKRPQNSEEQPGTPVRKPNYRGLGRATIKSRHPSGLPITENAFIGQDSRTEVPQDAGIEEPIFSDEQLEAVIAFHNDLPQQLSDPLWKEELKSAYMALCDEVGVPLTQRNQLWEQAKTAKN